MPAAADGDHGGGGSSPKPGTLKVLKGGYRDLANDSATDYSTPLSGAWLEHDTSSSFGSPVMFPSSTDLLGVATDSVAGGTHYVRENSAPAGWRTLPKLAWGGGTPTERDYVASASVNGATSTATIDSGTSTRFVNALANPPLPSSCDHGLKILLLLDRSGSTAPYKANYAAAAKTFVNTLAGTPTSLKITSFSSTVDSGNATSYQLSNAADQASANSKIDSVYSNPSGATNWDDALRDAASAQVDVVVFITDGNPTVRRNNSGSGGSTEIDDITYGVASANTAKNPDGVASTGDEQTMLGVGVGALSVANLAAVSGPTEGQDYTTAADPTDLAALLKGIASKLCGGKVKVTKSLVPSTDNGLFDLKIDGVTKPPAAGVGDNGSTGWLDTPVGDHTVTEAANASSPTTLADYASKTECRNKSGDIVGSGGAFSIKPDDEISCVITNTRHASVTVHKKTDPAGSATKFDFSGNPVGGSFQLAGGGSKQFSSLAAGSYNFSESVPAGWALTALECTGTATKPVVDGSKVTLTLAAGENADCTWTNTHQGRITIAKATDPTGSSQAFDFSGPLGGGSFSLTDGTEKSFDLAPGKYSVAETVAEGWDLADLKCTDPTSDSAVDLGSATVTVTLAAGETVKCVFTNAKQPTVTVNKELTPIGSGKFDLLIDGKAYATSVGDGGTTGAVSVKPGEHIVDEKAADGTEPSWFDATTSCLLDGKPIGIAGDFMTKPGDNVICTIKNVRQGSVTVHKVTDPGNSPVAFDFTGDPAGGSFQLFDGGKKTVDHLAPGSYSFSETVPAGWDLTKLECSGTAAKPVVDGSKVTIALAAGENADCTWTNTEKGHIKISKSTDPAGSSQVFDFTGPTDGGSFQLSDGQDKSFELAPGKYSVAESATAGWDLSSLECKDPTDNTTIDGATANIVLAAGETVSCEYKNTQQGSITVNKKTDPTGSPVAFDFTGDPAGGSFQLSDGQKNVVDGLTPGSYSFSETVPAGWDLTKLECSGTAAKPVVDGSKVTIALAAGENADCAWTNTQQGSITVNKKTDPAGSAVAFDFTGDPAGGNFQLSDGQSKKVDSLKPGSYSFSETVPAGWDLSKLECSGTAAKPVVDGSKVTIALAAGENADCTWTNTQQGSVTVRKTTNPSGSPVAFDFTGDPAGGSFQLSDGQSKKVDSLNPGSYSFSETVPTGWALTKLECSGTAAQPVIDGAKVTIALAAGENADCTWTNAQAGTIVIKKTVPEGSSGTFEFSGPGADDPNFSVASGDQASFIRAAGNYSVTELVKAGWDLTGLTCSDQQDESGGSTVSVADRTATINLSAGETVTCEFTNTEQQATLNVTKVLTDGSIATFGFTGSEPIGAFSLTTGGAADTQTFKVNAGTYSVTEDANSAYTLDSISCVTPGGTVTFPTAGRTLNLQLAAGETADCTFTNTPGGGVLPGRAGTARMAGSSGCARRTYAYENVAGTFISRVTWFVNHKRYKAQTKPNVRNRIYQLKFRTSALNRRYYAITAVVAFQRGVTPTQRTLRRSFRICTPLVSTG